MNVIFRFLMAFAALATVACNDDDPAVSDMPRPEKGDIVLEGTTSRHEIDGNKAGGVISICFTAPEDWMVMLKHLSRAEHWIEVQPQSGRKGGNSVELRMAPNSTDKARMAEIEFSAGEMWRHRIVVIQKAGKQPDEKPDEKPDLPDEQPQIEVAPDRFTISAQGGELATYVATNCAWKAECPEWVVVSPSEGEGNTDVVLRVAPYEDGDTERMLTVDFECGIGDKTARAQVSIMQEPKPEEPKIEIDVEPHTIRVPYEGGEFAAHILTEGSWRMYLNEALEVTPTEGFGITTVKIRVPQNTQPIPHTYVLRFAAGMGEQQQTVDLNLEQDPAPEKPIYPTLEQVKEWVAASERDYNTFLGIMLPALGETGGELFSNYNKGGVTDGIFSKENAKSPTFALDKPIYLVSVHTYHYFLESHNRDINAIIGAGIESWLEAEDGTTYGRGAFTDWFRGQGGMKGACWNTFPLVKIPAGTYRVCCSHPQSWSYNDLSEGEGFVLIYGIRQ